jgi:hypothetical protein
MVERRRTRDVHPMWMCGSDTLAGDKYWHRPGVTVYLCLAADRETTFVFTGALPITLQEAKDAVRYV